MTDIETRLRDTTVDELAPMLDVDGLWARGRRTRRRRHTAALLAAVLVAGTLTTAVVGLLSDEAVTDVAGRPVIGVPDGTLLSYFPVDLPDDWKVDIRPEPAYERTSPLDTAFVSYRSLDDAYVEALVIIQRDGDSLPVRFGSEIKADGTFSSAPVSFGWEGEGTRGTVYLHPSGRDSTSTELSEADARAFAEAFVASGAIEALNTAAPPGWTKIFDQRSVVGGAVITATPPGGGGNIQMISQRFKGFVPTLEAIVGPDFAENVTIGGVAGLRRDHSASFLADSTIYQLGWDESMSDANVEVFLDAIAPVETGPAAPRGNEDEPQDDVAESDPTGRDSIDIADASEALSAPLLGVTDDFLVVGVFSADDVRPAVDLREIVPDAVAVGQITRASVFGPTFVEVRLPDDVDAGAFCRSAIVHIQPDGTGEIVADGVTPAFSPNGTALAFGKIERVDGNCSVVGVGGLLFNMGREFEVALPRTPDSGDPDWQLSWTPDGSRLLVASRGAGTFIDPLDPPQTIQLDVALPDLLMATAFDDTTVAAMAGCCTGDMSLVLLALDTGVETKLAELDAPITSLRVDGDALVLVDERGSLLRYTSAAGLVEIAQGYRSATG